MIEQKFKETIALAEKLYSIDLSDVILEPSITGYRAIAQAGTYKCGTRKVRYSLAFLNNNPSYYLNEIVPHEVAHLVCDQLNLGNNHDMGWRRVAVSLGCTTPRASTPVGTFDVVRTPRAVAKRYKYVDTSGGIHQLTGQRHALIQKKGKTYTVKDSGATLNAKGYQNDK